MRLPSEVSSLSNYLSSAYDEMTYFHYDNDSLVRWRYNRNQEANRKRKPITKQSYIPNCQISFKFQPYLKMIDKHDIKIKFQQLYN